MPEIKSYTFQRSVLFAICDSTGITPNKANGLIKKMSTALKDFQYKNGYVKGYIGELDGFNINQTSPNLCIGSWKIRIEMVDENLDSEAAQRFNNSLNRLFGHAINKLRFHKYNTIIKLVESHDDLGDLSIPDQPKKEGSPEALEAEAQLIFYSRFAKAVADFPFLGRTLILEKEEKRIKNDRSLSDDVQKKLLKTIGLKINSFRQNMSEDELKEFTYFCVSLDLIPSI